MTPPDHPGRDRRDRDRRDRDRRNPKDPAKRRDPAEPRRPDKPPKSPDKPRRPDKPPKDPVKPRDPVKPPKNPDKPRDPVKPPKNPEKPKPPQGDTDPGGKPENPDPIAAMRADTPIALLPIRLATRFVRADGATEPHALRIRIFPDPIVVDGHIDRLTKYEASLGVEYWTQIAASRGDAEQSDQIRAWLIDQVGLPRARWIGAMTRPSNPAQVARGDDPKFGDLDVGADPASIVARLLPQQWMVQVRTGQEWQRVHWSGFIERSRPIVAAPQLADVPAGGIRSFLDGQGLEWRHDFDAARRAGMALEIPVEGEARTNGFSELIVVGVHRGDKAEDVEKLLERHRYHQGLRLLAQGTATNNTDQARVLAPSDTAPELSWRPTRKPDDGQRDRKNPADIYRLPQAARAAAALGLSSTDAFTGDDLADVSDTVWSTAMQRLVWPGVNSQLLDGVLDKSDPLLAANTRQWVRDWFLDHVSGRALLPTLGIGDHPYGMLPVTTLPNRLDVPDDDIESKFVQQLAEFETAWTGSDPLGALSPVDPGGRTGDDEAAEVAAVLGAVPHPTAYRARALNDDRARISSEFVAAEAELGNLVAALPGTDAVSVNNHYSDHLDRIADDPSAGSYRWALASELNTSFRFWVANSMTLFRHLDPNPIQAILNHIDNVMMPMLYAHIDRSQPKNLIPELGSGALPDPDDPALFYANYATLASDAPTLSLLGTSDVGMLRELLEARLNMVEAALNGERLDLPEDGRGLLFVLIDQSIRLARKDALLMMAEAVNVLLRLIDDDGQPAGGYGGAVEEITRLLRETLGLFTHRHDAWRTGLAAQRLADLRAARPSGLQVGAYGFVLDLLPDDGGADTDGFVHAPSLDHAAAAAMLRSAWRGLGQSASDVPFAVDLSSERVRRATWMLDGLRNGHELGELLGQRFERRLHDAGLDAWIDDVRAAVLAADGRGDEPTSSIVDGLAVASAYRSREGATFDTLEAVRDGAPKQQHAPLLAVLESAEADFDAVSDLLTTQAVMSLIQGDAATSAAALAALGSNAGGIPDIAAANTGTNSHVVTHRVAALLAPSTPGGHRAPLPQACCPTLEAWLRTMLPPIDDVRVRVEWLAADGAVTEVDQLTLGQLNIGATHLVSWVTSNEDPLSGRTANLVAAMATTIADDRQVRVLGTEFADLLVAASALAEAVGTARSITVADLIDPTAPADSDTTAAHVDLRELATRVDAAVARLHRLASDVQAGHTDSRYIPDLALIDFGAAHAVMQAYGTEDRQNVLDEAAARVTEVAEALDDVDRGDESAVVTALQRSVGSKLPMLPTLRLPDQQLAAMVPNGAGRLGDHGRFRTWMLANGRVHDGLGALHQSVLLTEALADRAVLEPALLQFPYLPDVDDGWAALDLPDFGASRTRMSLVSISDPTAALRHQQVCGLLFDAWSESIPGTDAATGVAVHMDAPSSQAPQAILLAVPPPDQQWSTDLMVRTLQQTAQAAQNRSIGPETMSSYGHILPAVFVDGKAKIMTTDEQRHAERTDDEEQR